MTGLTEVTLRKVYKELLENWDDLLPSNYTPAVPPERAFPTTVIASGRGSASKVDLVEVTSSSDRDKQSEIKGNKTIEGPDTGHPARAKEEAESRGNSHGASNPALSRPPTFWQPQAPFVSSGPRTVGDKNQNLSRGTDINELHSNHQELERKVEQDTNHANTNSPRPNQLVSLPTSSGSLISRQFWPPPMSVPPSNVLFAQSPSVVSGYAEHQGAGSLNGTRNANQFGDI